MMNSGGKASKARTRTVWRKALFALLIILVIAFAVSIWLLVGPASRAPHADLQGVPAGAKPHLTATEISELPLRCGIVTDEQKDDVQGRSPHRNHAYIIKFKGRYFLQYSFWYGPEDQPGVEVRFVQSDDGVTWSKPQVLAKPESGSGFIARGFVERNGNLYALLAAHTGDTHFRDLTDNKDDRDLAIVETRWLPGAQRWEKPEPFLKGYLNNYAPLAIGSQHYMALRDQDRETYLAVTHGNGTDWQISPAMAKPPEPKPNTLGLFLPDEPVVQKIEGNDAVVMLRNNSPWDGRLWAAKIEGMKRWGDPYPLAFPSASSKFFPIELADGDHALIGNFEPQVNRALLHIALSHDGEDYDRIYRLAIPSQYADWHWRSPQYPHAIRDGKQLLVVFSYGKRQIGLCRAPATREAIEKQAGFHLLPRAASLLCRKDNIYPARWLFGWTFCRELFV